MNSTMDDQIRLAAFNWLNKQVIIHGDSLPRSILTEGFPYSGQRIRLMGPQGIWKPQQMDLPISITTVIDGPYDDRSDSKGFLKYKYRGDNPNHRDNMGLREVLRLRKPLIYFFNIFPGKYLATYPVFVVNDNPSHLSFTVAVDDISYFLADPIEETEAETARRSYITQTVLYRAHQRQFRERVIAAYWSQCALCRLKHVELLDAAHIIGDLEDHGDPVVQNGLSLCKIHHAAFDSNLIGVSPDYTIEVRKDILLERDGPMLQYGFQQLHDKRIILPRSKELWPDQEKLEIRYDKFIKAV